MTRDHTLLEEDPYTNKKFGDQRLMGALTNGLGIHTRPVIEVKKYPIPKKGFIIMTTEGLSRRISNREILRTSIKSKKPEILRNNLIGLALKKGGNINGDLTVGVIRFGGLSREIRNILFTYSLFFLMVVILIGGYFLRYGNDEKHIKNLDNKEQNLEEKEFQPITETNRQPVTNIQVKKTIDKKPQEEKVEYADNTALYDRIFSLVGEWKTAWELSAGAKGDLDRYLSFYSEKFISGRFDKTAWKQDKYSKNKRKRWIKIEISDIRILGPDDNNHIEVRFLQDYTSSNYSSKGNKVLILSNEGDEWKIVNEISS